MNVQTGPPSCLRPGCRYPAYFALTSHGFEDYAYCSPLCKELAEYSVTVARMPASPEAESQARWIYAYSDLLNSRGDVPWMGGAE